MRALVVLRLEATGVSIHFRQAGSGLQTLRAGDIQTQRSTCFLSVMDMKLGNPSAL